MTGAAAALAASPAAGTGSEFPGVLDGVLLAGPAARLAAMLDQAFLAGAGWDPGSRMLSLPAGHRLLGRVVCRTGGCDATAHGTRAGGLCWRCFARLTRAGLSAGEITSSPELPPLPDRPPGCAVPGCLRMSPGGRQGQRTGLCQAHSRRFRRVPGMTMERFLADPRVRPLPALGPCNVAACARRAESEHGYCPTHYVRWRQAVTACPGAEERHWQLTEPAVSEGGRVSLRGLPPLVVTEVLFGIWQRAGDGAKITDVNLRAVCDALRRQQAGSIGACAPLSAFPARRAGTCWPRWPVRSAGLWPIPAPSGPGTPGTLRSSATPGGCHSRITQPWLREAAKGWAGEELPRHRGAGASNVRSTVNGLARLSESLRCRGDRGLAPAALGPDIENFLSRLGYLESAGTISRYHRNVICRGVRAALAGIRGLGLTRAGQPAAGLAGDFALGLRDIPAEPARGEPGRDLPPEIMTVLCASLDVLGPADVKAATQIAIDTGRRPEDILGLPLDCLARDADGAPVLVYDNAKAHRLGRRLPVSQATATVITGQQARVRARFPATPPGELKLLPAARRNPDGAQAHEHLHAGRPAPRLGHRARDPAHPRWHRVRQGQGGSVCLPAHLRPAARRRRGADRRPGRAPLITAT